MPCTPKYSSFTLYPAQEQALAATRATQADAERLRREAEAERLRQERIAAGRLVAATTLSALRSRAQGIGSGDLAHHAGVEVADLARGIDALAVTIAGAVDENEVARVQVSVERVGAELVRIEARARAAKLAADLDAEAAEAAEIEALLGTVDADRARRLDEAGARVCQTLVQTLKDAVQGGHLSEARRISAEALQAVTSHADTVERRYDEWRDRRDRAVVATTALADQVAATRADEVCARWTGRELSDLSAEVSGLGRLTESDHPEQVHGVCQSAVGRLAELAARAQQRQLDEDRRQVIVKGLITVMDRMAFTLQRGYPVAADVSDAASEVTIRVRRGADRRTIDVSIGIDGQVTYELDGFVHQLVTNSDGGQVPESVESEGLVEAFHAALEREFGVRAEELRWPGKDPNRIRRTAKHLPAGGSSSGAA